MLRLSLKAHRLLLSLLLLTVLARALVPTGFMPAASGSGGLVLCPAGMLMSDADAAQMGGGAHGVKLHVEHCPYGSAPFAAPLSQWAFVPPEAQPAPAPIERSTSALFTARQARAHQPRAPPFSV